MRKRIYLSAPALVCCAGQNRNELYESCLSGCQKGLTPCELSGAGGTYPTGIITEALPEPDVPEALVRNIRIIRVIDAALEQLRPVVEKAISEYGKEKIGVCLGTCDIGSDAICPDQNELLEDDAGTEDRPTTFHSASFCTEFIKQKFGISGPSFTVAAACASGSSAIVRGAELIRAGSCSAVIAGGADVVTESLFAGFRSLEAVSDSLTNPFSKNRNGINLGEGAAFFLLEPEKNSGVELLGAGESVDAYHMTAPATDGAGPARAMETAILDAGIDSKQIGYVNLHGTGTLLNDMAENRAMKTVFGEVCPPSSSTKPITGHALGAAGTLEAAICWMVLSEQKGLPVHCWDGVIDEEIPFSHIGGSGRDTPSICMSNSFGFGGCNVSLILGRS